MHRVGYHRIELNVYTQLQKRWFLNCMIHERCDPRALWEMFAQLRNQCFPFSIIYEKSFFLMKILSFQESLVGFHRLARATFCG